MRKSKLRCQKGHQKSCFFRTLSQRSFLEGPSADLASKIRFGSHFGSRGGVTKWPLGSTFSTKMTLQMSCLFVPELSQSRPGRDMVPKTAQNDPRIEFYRFLIDFGQLWDGFLNILDGFLMMFNICVHTFRRHFLTNSYSNVRYLS